MNKEERKAHWESIYKDKNQNEVSWYQQVPSTSLSYIDIFKLPLTARIIDIGGGDSFLVDHLIKFGYQDITVLDISAEALSRAKYRLGDKAKKIKWINTDILDFTPNRKYDYWHDRAAFHFLTNEKDISIYQSIANEAISDNGYMVIGSFSDKGPEKCSGIRIKQHTKESLKNIFEKHFKVLDCVPVVHRTPSDSLQHFIFCSFKKIPETK